jgi:hypothetical protein
MLIVALSSREAIECGLTSTLPHVNTDYDAPLRLPSGFSTPYTLREFATDVRAVQTYYVHSSSSNILQTSLFILCYSSQRESRETNTRTRTKKTTGAVRQVLTKILKVRLYLLAIIHALTRLNVEGPSHLSLAGWETRRQNVIPQSL